MAESPAPAGSVAPNQIGIQVTGADANSQAGIHAREMKLHIEALDSIRLWSEQYTADELESLGLPTGTGVAYKSAMAEVPSMMTALQNTVFLKKLMGLGVP